MRLTFKAVVLEWLIQPIPGQYVDADPSLKSVRLNGTFDLDDLIERLQRAIQTGLDMARTELSEMEPK
jgi:ferric-dicitrate binding protein FerR (iron transport regulator)